MTEVRIVAAVALILELCARTTTALACSEWGEAIGWFTAAGASFGAFVEWWAR